MNKAKANCEVVCKRREGRNASLLIHIGKEGGNNRLNKKIILRWGLERIK